MSTLKCRDIGGLKHHLIGLDVKCCLTLAEKILTTSQEVMMYHSDGASVL